MTETGGGRAWLKALAVYLDRRVLVILAMGFSSGLPLLLTLSTLSYWLSKVGVDKTAIGLFALVGVPYSFKFAWAPLLDQVNVPLLTRWLGRRRSWILVAQVGLIGSILVMGATDPAIDPLATAAAALAVAFFSASQDIVIDAYRIEILAEHEQGAGAGATQLGYRIGLLAAGAGAVALSDFISWFWIFAILAALVAVSMLVVLAAPRPPEPAVTAGEKASRAPDRALAVKEWIMVAVVAPFVDFMKRPHWLLILAFALLYKFGDAIGGTMANPFYVELGFTGVEIASVTKVFGVIATLAGILVGGVVVARYGLFFALLIGGILQAVSNLLFAAQAAVGHDLGFLALSIGADNFTGGLGSAAFVAYLSSLCTTGFSGTQYALLTSLMAFGRTVLSSGGGWLADHMDWITFFTVTTLLAIPGLALLAFLMRHRPPATMAAPEPAPVVR
jgi:MFS transporter, PAT family, beta-lactamase induction signal transducer AmpG